MSKEELEKILAEALADFEHQSIQATTFNSETRKLAEAVYRLMDTFRENIINYLE